MTFHVLLSLVTAVVLSAAGFQAVILAIQERLLRYQPSGRFVNRLPPLVTMEKLLFRVIAIGFVLLSVLLATSVYYFHEFLSESRLLWQKTILATLTWLIFAGLLMGRHFWGWRGRKAVIGTLCAVALLIIIYFGSELLLEGLH